MWVKNLTSPWNTRDRVPVAVLHLHGEVNHRALLRFLWQKFLAPFLRFMEPRPRWRWHKFKHFFPDKCIYATFKILVEIMQPCNQVCLLVFKISNANSFLSKALTFSSILKFQMPIPDSLIQQRDQ